MGSIGWLATALRGPRRGELTEPVWLMYDASQLAPSRMKNEAGRLGVDGIVGANPHLIAHGTDAVEVCVVDAAVRRTGSREREGRGSRAQVVIPVAGDTRGTTASFTAPQPGGGGGTAQQQFVDGKLPHELGTAETVYRAIRRPGWAASWAAS